MYAQCASALLFLLRPPFIKESCLIIFRVSFSFLVQNRIAPSQQSERGLRSWILVSSQSALQDQLYCREWYVDGTFKSVGLPFNCGKYMASLKTATVC